MLNGRQSVVVGLPQPRRRGMACLCCPLCSTAAEEQIVFIMQLSSAVLLVVTSVATWLLSLECAGCSLRLFALYPEALLPTGTTLALRGAGSQSLSWDQGVPLRRDAANTFSTAVAVDCVSFRLELKVLLDDSGWQLGPNSICSMSAGAPFPANCTFFPFFMSTTGQYQLIENVFSPQLNNTRSLVVYTPPSFRENPFATYPLLLMHDGQNVFNASTAFMGHSWEAATTIDSLIMGETLEEIVVVAVDNTPDRIDELTYSFDPSVQGGGKGDKYLDFIAETVLPVAYSLFPRFDTKKPVILGSSLGGLISCYAALSRPTVFAAAGCMSSSFWWNDEDFLSTILPRYADRKLSQEVRIYVDSGNAGPDDDDEAQSLAVVKALESAGWSRNTTLACYVQDGGQHSEIYWAERFHVPLLFFFGV